MDIKTELTSFEADLVALLDRHNFSNMSPAQAIETNLVLVDKGVEDLSIIFQVEAENLGAVWDWDEARTAVIEYLSHRFKDDKSRAG